MDLQLNKIIDAEFPYQELKQHDNYLEAGSGSLATVFVHENLDIAIKLIKSDDIGYKAYIDAIAMSKPNSLFPKVYDRIKCSNGQEIYVVERLYEVSFFYDDNTKQFNNISNKINKIRASFYDWSKKYIITAEEQDAVDTIKLAHMYANDLLINGEEEVSIDLHSGNFMLRKNKNLVIIDPLCDNEALELNNGYSGYCDSPYEGT